MITPMFGNRRKPKKFDYPFRHYDPKEDERKKRRIRIKRPHKKHHQGRSILLYAICLAFVVWLIYSLTAGKLAEFINAVAG
ncbi:MAG: hypothetical protein JXR26_03695 [Balneolaceae bacterium]|nr:hypothetical protein [Balneolaceae bacterium]